ncbi:MAG: YkgJ family cysteine cluster protein [Candidatus Heimdallarchaeota archaeon]|nr:YkgJ family cysteine cluster protein [Candidatus Heimdallarchaeota archaeon]
MTDTKETQKKASKTTTSKKQKSSKKKEVKAETPVEEPKEETQTDESEKKEKKKFKFECTRCGKCCQNREPIPVTFSDIIRWTKQGSFMSIILPHLELRSVSSEDELAKIAIVPFIRMLDEDETGKGTCPFYDAENKMCNIYFTLPLFCKTFPLSYNGEKFYVSDPSCEGLGKGEMTREKLQEMRDLAVRDFNERADTTLAMIPLQGLFIRHFMKQSEQQIENLSEEDKKKLDELIKKSQEAAEKEGQNKNN